MGRAPCCDKANVKRGPWSPEEDTALRNYVEKHGTGGNWIALPHKAGLKRCGKSCRLRWLNYLRPDIKHGGFTDEEDNTICTLYQNIGSRWSVIASHLPGRTDNDVKNYWNTKLKKKLMAAKTNLTDSANISPSNHIQLSNSTSPVSAITSDQSSHNNCFSNSMRGISTSSTLSSIELVNFGACNEMESLRFSSHPTQLSLPGTRGAPEFGGLVNNFSVSSSSLPAESSCLSWSGNGYGDFDGFSMNMEYASPCELLHGFDSEDKVLEVGPSLANISYSNLLAGTETKPHGVISYNH